MALVCGTPCFDRRDVFSLPVTSAGVPGARRSLTRCCCSNGVVLVSAGDKVVSGPSCSLTASGHVVTFGKRGSLLVGFASTGAGLR